MDANFLTQDTKFDELQKSIIAGNISNKEEMLKSDTQVEFEDKIRKGEVEVITQEDVKETYGDNFYLRGDIEAVENKIEETITKGEEDFIEQEEWDAIQTTRNQLEGLVSKAIVIQKGDKTSYLEIFVKAEAENEDGGEGEV